MLGPGACKQLLYAGRKLGAEDMVASTAMGLELVELKVPLFFINALSKLLSVTARQFSDAQPPSSCREVHSSTRPSCGNEPGVRLCKAILFQIPLTCNSWEFRLQRVAGQHRLDIRCLFLCACLGLLPLSRLAPRTAQADPVHLLVAAKSNDAWTEALSDVVFIVPVSQLYG